MKTSEIAIPLPCTVDWQSMTPRDGGRFCGDCKKVVRDLSKLTETEARALLATPPREGLCVRLLHDKRGTIFFADMITSSLVPATFLMRAKRAAATAAAVALPFAVQACTAIGGGESSDHDTSELTPLQGGAMPGPTDNVPDLSLPDGGADASPDATTLDTDGGADAAPDAFEGPK